MDLYYDTISYYLFNSLLASSAGSNLHFLVAFEIKASSSTQYLTHLQSIVDHKTSFS